MAVVLCPGFHASNLTDAFQTAIWQPPYRSISPVLAMPANSPPYSGQHILQFVRQQLWQSDVNLPPLTLIGFSAGVVGAITAAWEWQKAGGVVRSLIALDGWGVPLWGDFPIHRISHDFFTHWSSALLSQGQDSFYADPPVDHLELWRAPQTVEGQQISTNLNQPQKSTTAAAFIRLKLQLYGELS